MQTSTLTTRHWPDSMLVQCCLIRHTVYGYSCNMQVSMHQFVSVKRSVSSLNGTTELLHENHCWASCLLWGKVRVVPLQSEDNTQTSPLGLVEVRNKSGTGSREMGQPMKSYLSWVFTFPFDLILHHRLRLYTHLTRYLWKRDINIVLASVRH